MKKILLSIKQFSSKFACVNGRLSTKLGGKVLLDTGLVSFFLKALL